MAMDAHNEFWCEKAQRLDWITPFTKGFDGDFSKGDISWFKDGELNACVNCVDRHLHDHADKTAIIWEGDAPGTSRVLTFQDLYDHVCRFANLLKDRGVKKGDRVCIYMPMIPEAAMAMLACARIGAIHSVVFAGFSPESLKSRIDDASCRVVITASVGKRSGKQTRLKFNVDESLKGNSSVHSVIVVRNCDDDIAWHDARDVDYHAAIQTMDAVCPPEIMNAEDPLFILYTSGSTGKPKGVVHTTGGYLLYAAYTHEKVFDIKQDDVYWCCADVGWVTGHSYIVYGPLANATTTLMYEGVPSFPDCSRLWQIIDYYQVSIFYTAPTAIRALMAQGNGPLLTTSRDSLRMLGTVGEPINPEAWQWYFKDVGRSRCKVMDTWWQTETGGVMLAPLCDLRDEKPGAAMRAMPGIDPVLLDAKANVIDGEAEGALAIAAPWPGMMRTIYGDHPRFISTYLSTFPGFYNTGDGAKRDADGDLWITGRTDDVLNVSGHRLGSAEIESALVLHPAVAEAAVVGCPHAIKGEGVYAFVTLMAGEKDSDALQRDLIQFVRKQIGPIATIDHMKVTAALPKTRSGKIMRRILRKIAAGKTDDFGDTSTLADASVLQNF
jgi:acetyl-CoA synthetase